MTHGDHRFPVAPAVLALTALAFLVPQPLPASGHGEKPGRESSAPPEESGHKPIEETLEEKAAREQRQFDKLLENIGSENAMLVEHSVYAMERLGVRAVPPLLEYFKKHPDNHRLRVNILYTFGRLGKNGRQAIPLLVSSLKHEDIEYRGVAAIALGKIGEDAGGAVTGLRRLMFDEDPWVSANAVAALKAVGSEKALKAAGEFEQLYGVVDPADLQPPSHQLPLP